jgi:hypothetical protein
MPKHGKNRSIWPEVLGLIAVACAFAAFLLLVLGNPQWHP